jgi:predicted transcriptional regulator
MKSVRLDAELEARLRRAAGLAGVSESEFIRQAIEERASTTLDGRLDDQLAGLIGAIKSDGGRAAAAHSRFRELLRKRTARKPASRR